MSVFPNDFFYMLAKEDALLQNKMFLCSHRASPTRGAVEWCSFVPMGSLVHVRRDSQNSGPQSMVSTNLLGHFEFKTILTILLGWLLPSHCAVIAPMAQSSGRESSRHLHTDKAVQQ